MRKAILSSVLLAISIACTGCSSGADGGGAGGSGPSTAFSFDVETAEEAVGASAVATTFATRFGSVVSNLFTGLSGGLGAASLGVGPKTIIPIPPGFCQSGTATLDWQGPGPDLSKDDAVILTLDDCSGSPVSVMPANGTIRLDIISASGGIPIIGGIITAKVTLDLSIDPDTTITGSFALDANLPNLSLANLTFGEKAGSDLITFTEGFFQTQLACFDIYQRVGLQAPVIEFFRPLGVMKISNQVFTLNSYEEVPANILFDFAGFDATPRSGSLTLDSGDLSPDGLCEVFSGNPPPNQSFVTATFTGGGCVSLDGMDTEGVPFSITRTWDSLLEVGRPGGPGDSCGAGGTGGSGVPTTGATPSPVQCFMGNDVVADADAYIRGNGSAGEFDMTSFGNASQLLIRSATDLSFARKIYIVFDLTSLSDSFSFSKASLVLTLERHVENMIEALSGPQPVDVYGITANPDWDPAMLAEDAITWDNAPRNDKIAPNRFEDSLDVPLLIAGYDFDLEGDGVIDVPGTKYALDITEYVTERLANDNDGKITILMAIPTATNVDGSAFRSLDIPDEDMCDRPFLHFE
jgi:hypothetical protein